MVHSFTPSITGQAMVVKAFDDGSKQRPFGHCLVAGVDRAPLKVTRCFNLGMLDGEHL